MAFAIELSSQNKKQLLIPKGFAHGYSVVSDIAEVFYKCDSFYNKDSEGGIAWNDPALEIDWQIAPEKAIISEKDSFLPTLQNSTHNFVFNG
jgi:dTDP-4-dehydrorhamnose 3,5-epimerase